MSNVAKLKKKAAELELKKDFAKALAVYVELLDNFDQHAAELDVSLFNRVGDLMLRQGSVADAVDYYERAVVRYVDGGFYNNAIALCNKILRHSPGRASVYYILGKISAHKGFTTDAKQNFLEYADRMQKSGNMDEAFRAMKEFADLCPGQDDVRLMLSEQLSKLDRKDEAVEQLQILWARFQAEGKQAEADAMVARMKAIDPSAQPKADGGKRSAGKGDLVFLDLDDLPTQRGGAPSPPRKQGTPLSSAVADLPLLDSGEDEEEEAPAPARGRPPAAPPASRASQGRPVASPPRSHPPPDNDADVGASQGSAGSLLGLEPTSFGGASNSPPSSPESLDIEPTSFAPTRPAGPPLIEPEASATLLPDGEVIDGPSESRGSQEGLSTAESGFDLSMNDPYGLGGIAQDSSSLHIDLPPTEGSSSNASFWQSTEGSPFGDDNSLDNIPPLLRGESMGLENPLAESGSRESNNSGANVPLIDFDTSALDSGSETLGNGAGTSPPASFRRSTMSAERSAEVLQAEVDDDPDNWVLRRELAEKMLESGDREGGVRELESAMMGAERANELDLASSIAEEIARLAPDTVRFHQKRVEYAFRTNDKLRLIEAYLALAGALLGSQQGEKARAVYQRVLDLAPDDIRAQAALESLSLVDSTPAEPPPPARKSGARKPSSPTSSPVRTRGADPLPAPGDAGFVNLGDLLRDDGPKSTRMIVEEEEPTGDEEADFADMLKKFKQGIAENVDKEDYQSHYDLGVAFKEMGLIDEAIAEFQKALKAPSNRLPTYEALGQCFIEKEQFGIASTVLARALNDEGHSDDSLVGVLYLLGRAFEALNRTEEALSYYQRVFVVDIEFRDIVKRIRQLERTAR